MTKFNNVGDAMLKRNALITRLAQNRDTLRTVRNTQDSPAKAASVAVAEANHEKDCDAFTEAHRFVVENRVKP